ncbi:MAG: SDR family oxidoreductase [Actinobacteria bacterium]|nr:SDR family oxidoreductase [Actinomycetota bacterium]
MTGRLEGKAGIIVGAGQTAGETIGNGRAASLLFAREGARVLLVDRDMQSAEETAAMISQEGDAAGAKGAAEPFEADWTKADQCAAYAAACVDAFGRIDFLHNNVGIGAGDASVLKLEEDVFDRILTVNLKGCLLSCKAVLPVMREQQSGSIVNISSIAAVASTPLTAYKISKLGMNALGQSLANSNARHGIRVNTIMPGLMDTPMAIEIAAEQMGITRDELRAARDRSVPLRGKQGTAWDIARAALFLHSDEAGFISGVVLPVDGGQSARVG